MQENFDIVYIIAELDPPHTGHAHIMAEARRRLPGCAVAVIMSGHFTQRGTPAVTDRFTRARAALCTGADLVLSLPFPFCAASAENFARGGVAVAGAFARALPNARHTLVFGSECGDTAALAEAASRMSEPKFRRALYEGGGHNARRTFELYGSFYGGDASEILRGPNDMLGIEYIRALTASGCGIVPLAVPRVGAGHGDGTPSGGYASSSALRAMLKNGSGDAWEYMTPGARDAVREAGEAHGFADCELFDAAVTAILRMKERNAFDTVAECGGGVGRRLLSAALASGGEARGAAALAATKRYTNARLRRAALFAAVGVDAEALSQPPAYTQLLAANEVGISLLRMYGEVGAQAEFPVVTKFADGVRNEKAAAGLMLEARADRLYTMAYSPHLPADTFLKMTPCIMK